MIGFDVLLDFLVGQKPEEADRAIEGNGGGVTDSVPLQILGRVKGDAASVAFQLLVAEMNGPEVGDQLRLVQTFDRASGAGFRILRTVLEEVGEGAPLQGLLADSAKDGILGVGMTGTTTNAKHSFRSQHFLAVEEQESLSRKSALPNMNKMRCVSTRLMPSPSTSVIMLE